MNNEHNTTTEAATDPQGRLDALVMRIERHLQQMAPHVKERQTGQLLIEALGELHNEQEAYRSLAFIKHHMKTVSPTGYQMSGIYHLACNGLPDA